MRRAVDRLADGAERVGGGVAGAAEDRALGGLDRVVGVVGERDGGGADGVARLGDLALPAAVEGGERVVAALVGQRGQVGEQRRDVLGVEHREAQRLVALEHEVAGRVAQPGEPVADALGGGEAVQAALGGLLRRAR